MNHNRPCSICGKTFRSNPALKNTACAVMHPEGSCCHYSETEIAPTDNAPDESLDELVKYFFFEEDRQQEAREAILEWSNKRCRNKLLKVVPKKREYNQFDKPEVIEQIMSENRIIDEFIDNIKGEQ